jgi:hypothetical protein
MCSLVLQIKTKEYFVRVFAENRADLHIRSIFVEVTMKIDSVIPWPPSESFLARSRKISVPISISLTSWDVHVSFLYCSALLCDIDTLETGAVKEPPSFSHAKNWAFILMNETCFWINLLMLLQEAVAFGSMRFYNQYWNSNSNWKILSSGNADFSWWKKISLNNTPKIRYRKRFLDYWREGRGTFRTFTPPPQS